MVDYDNFDETKEIFAIFQRFKFHVIESETGGHQDHENDCGVE